MDLRLEAGYTSTQLGQLTGLTYRQLDYLNHAGVLTPSLRPANGSGSRRIYSDSDLARARLIAALRGLHATNEVIAAVLGQLDNDPAEWPEFMFVTAGGVLGANRPAGAACWMITRYRLLNPEPAVDHVAA